jgi:hypothetical protein
LGLLFLYRFLIGWVLLLVAGFFQWNLYLILFCYLCILIKAKHEQDHHWLEIVTPTIPWPRTGVIKKLKEW